MRFVGVINRHNPPRVSVWKAWRRALTLAVCKAVTTGDTTAIEWLARASNEMHKATKN